MTISQAIQNRKAVYPPLYNDKPIPKEIINEILENANRAPTHRLTEPWRFKVIRGKGKARFADFLAEKYKDSTIDDNFSERKHLKLQENPRKADTIIVIVMKRDSLERVPEWEEVAAVAMAVQNMWLTATAHEIGSYWSSPSLIEFMDEFISMEPSEKCLGFFYMGYYDDDVSPSKRTPIEEKTSWIES
ncbi:nitroreductase [Leptobacterium sp. I13]|uniref:nitroreductase family protein n=1 Tax=Leptobacterium meishanense TaxID=3128904 RepID=UPI0030ED63D0